MGCFHRHFQVKPKINKNGGLKVGKDRGNHEYDYYIEVSVTSKANLTTVLTKKVGFYEINWALEGTPTCLSVCLSC